MEFYEYSMEGDSVIICEALCFLSNKYDNFKLSELKPVLVSFYTDEELVAAKEILVKAVQQCLRDVGEEADMPRLPRRQGDNKCKQTTDDILKLFTIADEKKFRDVLPTFVARDLSRIPFLSTDGITTAAMARRIEAIEQRLMMMEDRSTVPPIQMESFHDVANSEDPGAPLDADTSQTHYISQATHSAADNHDDNLPWNDVVRRHCPPQVRQSQLGQQRQVRQKGPVHTQHRTQETQRMVKGKVFGTRRDGTLKPGVDIVRKAVVHVDNLSPECTEALLQDYLISNDIQVLTCYTAKSWLRQGEKERVTAFRVCVPLSQKQKIFDPNIWSEGVIIRHWRFKQTGHGEQA